jgi:hypothetical protein
MLRKYEVILLNFWTPKSPKGDLCLAIGYNRLSKYDSFHTFESQNLGPL